MAYGRPRPDPVGEGQESVWDYPRPPALVRSDRHVLIRLADMVIAETRRAWRVLETSHPPTWYVPREDVASGVLRRSAVTSTVCEWKGKATYWDVVLQDGIVPAVMWSYESPTIESRWVVGFEDGVLGAHVPLVIAAGSVSRLAGSAASRAMEVSEK